MVKAVYEVKTEADVALSAGVPKTILGVLSGAAFGLQLEDFDLAFDGVSASGVPVLVELCRFTFATNPPGTNSISVTPVQSAGRIMAAGTTAARNWTTEPTVATVIKEMRLTPNAGVLVYPFNFTKEPDCGLSEGFGIRLTAGAAVNARASIAYSRI